jgi:hypothetical protein
MFDNLAIRTYEAIFGIWPNLITGLVSVIVTLIIALIVLIVGWLIAIGIGSLVSQILNLIKLNEYFQKAGWKGALEKAEIKLDAAAFIGMIFKWIVFIIVLMIVAEILGLTQFAGLLGGVLGYLPNVIVAVFLFVAAVIIAEIVEKVVRVTVEGTKVGHGAVAGAIVKWSIWVFAILAILEQLGIAENLIQTLYTGVIAFLVIAFGVAFGLGGKDVAAEILKDLKQKFLG